MFSNIPILLILILLFYLVLISNTLYNLFTIKVLKIHKKDKALASEVNTSRPKVSVLIPARNEEQNIATLLQQLVAQTYQKLEILVLDDNSEDATYKIASQFKNEHIKLFKGKSLPNGWRGKPWACQQLSEYATGELLLFLDADVRVEPQFVEALVQSFKPNKSDIITVFPSQNNKSIGEKITVPLINWLVATFYPGLLMKFRPIPDYAVAIGQVLAFTREAYQKVGSHKAVKATTVEDLAFARLAVKKEMRLLHLRSDGIVKVRMYDSFKTSVKGLSRSMIGGLEHTGISGLILYPAFIWLPFLLIFAFTLLNPQYTLLIVLLAMSQAILVALFNKFNIELILLYPIFLISYFGISISSLYFKLSNQLEWRGRKLNTK